MQATDVMTTLDLARAKAGVDQVHVVHRPRLLSDNGPCYVSQALGTYLTEHGLTHTRGAPYHPMTQGKIERYHRSMKNVVKLDVYHSPWELERAIGHFVEHYNHRRLHEALQNVTPADVYKGRQGAILDRRARIKRETLARRKRENLKRSMSTATRRECDLLTTRMVRKTLTTYTRPATCAAARSSGSPRPWVKAPWRCSSCTSS